MQIEAIKFYKEIYNSIINLIPEKWEKICLYASNMQNLKGEMYFYYFPKKLIKAKPVNCYEVANKFGLDENTYNDELSKLYIKIKKLKQVVNSPWTNITIIIEKNLFTTEFHYENIRHSKYSDEQRHIIWEYKYLNIPLDSLSKKEQDLITYYKEESKIKPTVIIEQIENFDKEQIKNPILKITNQ